MCAQVAEQDWLQSLSTPLVTGRLLAPSWGGARDAGAAPRATAAGDTWQAPADSAGRDTARLPEPWSPPMSPSQTVSRAARADGAAMPAELVADALARQSSTASMDGGPEPSQSRPALAVSATGEDARGVRVAERAGARPAEFQVKAVPPGFKPLLVVSLAGLMLNGGAALRCDERGRCTLHLAAYRTHAMWQHAQEATGRAWCLTHAAFTCRFCSPRSSSTPRAALRSVRPSSVAFSSSSTPSKS